VSTHDVELGAASWVSAVELTSKVVPAGITAGVVDGRARAPLTDPEIPLTLRAGD